ncbi:MAG: pilus (MSHA type) biogenesis protein MshL [Pseudomonadota bacterium]
MRSSHAIICATGMLLAACGTKPIEQSTLHLQQTPESTAHSAGDIPQPVKQTVVLPPPQKAKKLETYSVVVTSLPAREILFALARDAKINIDIYPGIEGNVTVNAINQTLPQILDRIAKQIDIRYELRDGLLTVMPDTPYLKSYKIDYVNMARDATGGISNSTQVGGSTGGATTAATASNNSQLSIKNQSSNHFWATLEKNIKDILQETDKEIVVSRRASSQQEQAAKTSGDNPEQAAAEKAAATAENTDRSSAQEFKDYQTLQAATVITNPEAGLITVRATGKQHEKVQEFIAQVMRNARRQVLIEATIAEVRLSSNYQQGINWSAIAAGAKGFTLTQLGSAGLPSTNTGNMFTLKYNNATSKFGNLSGAVSLLDSFGDVKVLSSPKLSVMNNQTAMLRVVDNLVYFTIKADTTTNQTTTTTTYTTTPITVPTGFTMSVTPQINDSDSVLLNLRPSITRLLGYVNDPNPALAAAGVVSRIPQLQTREMESMLKIENNQIAVLGGLMQDDINNLTDGVPLLQDIPLAGNLFKNRNDTKTKTELVIFLRPIVIKDASLEGDYAGFRDSLPDADFMATSIERKEAP